MSGALAVFFVASMLVTFVYLVLSRRELPAPADGVAGEDDLVCVFVLPCLNEAMVIGASLDRLLAIPGRRHAILVVDDGSDDETAEIVTRYMREHSNVRLLRRTAPDARQGKGAALNHACRHLRESGLLGARRPDDVIVAIVDADGRVRPDVLDHVLPHFRDPSVGAAQIGVRILNAAAGPLARMQDMEFVIFLDIFQRGRMQTRSVGLGGNGQFARLSALASLGEEPWSDCLTEDLDLGVRLLAAGWSNAFCHTTFVAQQGLLDFRRLVKQRTRWFQGNLQCWRLLPRILRSDLPHRAVGDLALTLLAPALILVTSLVSVAFGVAFAVLVATDPGVLADLAAADGGLLLAACYVLTFGLAPLFAWIYRRHTPSVSRREALSLGHQYCTYGYVWYLAGWRAVGRILMRRGGWAKTLRVPESQNAPERPSAPERQSGLSAPRLALSPSHTLRRS